MAEKRVVITGMGLVCPMGNNVDDSWAKIRAGESGIDWISLFDADLVENRVAGEVRDLDLAGIFGRREMRRMDRAQMLALVAAEEALNDAEIVINADNQYDVGVVVGSGIGGIVTVVQALQGFAAKGHRGVSPVIVPALLHDGISSRVSMRFGLKGPNYNITVRLRHEQQFAGRRRRPHPHGPGQGDGGRRQRSLHHAHGHQRLQQYEGADEYRRRAGKSLPPL